MIRYRVVGREHILNWRGVTLRWRKGRIELRTPRRILTGLAETAGFTLPPDELLRQLQEFDPASIDLMVQNIRIGGGSDNTETERKNAVEVQVE